MEYAVQHPVSRIAIPAPIVRINDQHPSSTVVPDARFRYTPRVGNYQSPWLTRSGAGIVIHCADVLHCEKSKLTATTNPPDCVTAKTFHRPKISSSGPSARACETQRAPAKPDALRAGCSLQHNPPVALARQGCTASSTFGKRFEKSPTPDGRLGRNRVPPLDILPKERRVRLCRFFGGADKSFP